MVPVAPYDNGVGHRRSWCVLWLPTFGVPRVSSFDNLPRREYEFLRDSAWQPSSDIGQQEKQADDIYKEVQQIYLLLLF